MLPKRPKETPNPNGEPITANEVQTWLTEAGLAEHSGNIAESFSRIVEIWRRRNRRSDDRVYETENDVAERIETLIAEIRGIAEDLHKKIEQLWEQAGASALATEMSPIKKLSTELGKFRMTRSLRRSGQPRALWADVAIEFYVQLRPAFPSAVDDQTIYALITRALARCGWDKKKKEVALKMRHLPRSKKK